jgi:S-DNA-T family DNA segregation ATPase FtsK/SpoIIIE
MMRRRRYHRRRFGFRRHDPVPLLYVPDEGSYGAAALVWTIRAIWRYRSELAPLTTAAVLACAGLWLHIRHMAWWPWLAALCMALVVAIAAIPPHVGWVRRWAPLDRRVERAYTALCVAFGGGWLTAATAIGPTHHPLPALAVTLTIVCAVPWWEHHRRRARVRVERTLEAWPDLSEEIGLTGSRILSAVVDRWGFTVRLAIRAGLTARHLIDAIPAIETALGTRPGAVRVEPDVNRADRATVRVVETDPHAQPIPFPRQPAGQASITRPIPLGVSEDGTPVAVPLLRRNVLVGGITDSGKSGLVNVILATLVTCRDTVIWGVDLKGGMELGPWLRCLDRLATTPQQAVAMLADAVSELDGRTHQLSARGQRLWQPNPTEPALIVIVDEYAELPDSAADEADSLTRRGRAVAVNMLAATQRPTQKAMGQGAVRSQMDVRISLRVRERRDTTLILGDGMLEAGWHPHTLDAPGKFLISSREHITPKRNRAYLITDTDVAEIARANAPHRPTLPTRDLEYRESPAIEAPRPQAGTSVVSLRPEDQLWQSLCAAPEDGISVSELINATGKYRTWVYERLQEHAKAGRAIRTVRGSWRATDAYREA